ncbi:zinc-dependent metalloprotease [Paeniglutamicibacter kerguelensis]|uniref:Hydrolase n=1 Tax=Paeniglutamicibacter kerguelensis TaxID=254788 RepID=A0ABS4XE17_9MICC|nr:zinc-dependent metalloprotease [Paeniglutamicibacter kerguelensis]MBP2386712.1 putative hydrolase [Paeniglutamicibacter kerguelensis]
MAENPPSNRPDDSENNDENPKDPFSEMFGALFGGAGGFDPKNLPAGLGEAMGVGNNPDAMAQMMRQAQAMMAAMSQGGSGPVNWKMATDTARQSIVGDDPSVSAARASAIANAAQLADLWLDAATALEGDGSTCRALSRTEWVEKTMPVWKSLTEPVAISVGKAITLALTEQIPEQMRPMIGGAQGMLQSLGGTMFGMQLGTAVGGLAKDVLGATDIGLPLAGSAPALVPTNLAAFGEGLEVPEQEILLFAALRECAHVRLFNRVPWLRSTLIGAIEAYARGIHIDMSRIEDAVRDIDPMNPESMQSLMGEGLFMPKRTPAQDAALEKLELVLALVEGWVDQVVAAAAVNLPSAGPLRETIRRRRASGGPAENAFASLVGLELRPRRLREAAALWAHLLDERGIEGRDAVWDHPDLMPTSEDLQDPAGFTPRRQLAEASMDDIDAALSKLLSGGFDAPEAADTAEADAEDAGDQESDGDEDTEGDAPADGEPQGK